MGETEGKRVLDALAFAELVLASNLTLVECDRVLIRAVVSQDIPEAQAAQRRAALNRASAHWNILRLEEEVVERARRPFPSEPVRTLDALHLSCALLARSSIPDVAILSLDHRVRSSARLLGFTLIPEQDGSIGA